MEAQDVQNAIAKGIEEGLKSHSVAGSEISNTFNQSINIEQIETGFLVNFYIKGKFIKKYCEDKSKVLEAISEALNK